MVLRVAKHYSRRDRDRGALTWAERAAVLDPDWAEPWVAVATLRRALGQSGAACEALIGANARDRDSRVIALMLGLALDELGICGESYEWLVRAAHAYGAADESVADGHPDSLFWRELGLYCIEHDRPDEAIEVAALSELVEGWSGGVRRS